MIAALVIGFVGSLHCMGMCGPLALYVTGNQRSPAAFVRYHGGRLLSYMILGALLGWVGYSVQLLQGRKKGSIDILQKNGSHQKSMHCYLECSRCISISLANRGYQKLENLK